MQKNQIIAIGIGSILLIVVLYFVVTKNVFTIQHTSQPASKTALEKSRGLTEGALQDIQGDLYIGPYKSLREQWYEFIGYPHTFRFWIYNFILDDAKRFFHELGVNNTRIQGIVESSQFASKTNHYTELFHHFRDNPNISLIPDDRLGIQFQHAKTFLTDEKFIIQTANLTYSSFNKNREIFFFSTDTGVVNSLQKLFYNDWMSQPTSSVDLHANLVVCPINCRSRLEGLLQSARNSIIMYQQYIADDSIQHILRAKKEQGVDIKIILGDRGNTKTPSNTTKPNIVLMGTSEEESDSDTLAYTSKSEDDQFIEDMGTSVKMQSSPYVHAKAILIDGQFLLVSSMNISDTSIDENREIGILLINPFQIEKYTNIFMKDWMK